MNTLGLGQFGENHHTYAYDANSLHERFICNVIYFKLSVLPMILLESNCDLRTRGRVLIRMLFIYEVGLDVRSRTTDMKLKNIYIIYRIKRHISTRVIQHCYMSLGLPIIILLLIHFISRIICNKGSNYLLYDM